MADRFDINKVAQIAAPVAIGVVVALALHCCWTSYRHAKRLKDPSYLPTYGESISQANPARSTPVVLTEESLVPLPDYNSSAALEGLEHVPQWLVDEREGWGCGGGSRDWDEAVGEGSGSGSGSGGDAGGGSGVEEGDKGKGVVRSVVVRVEEVEDGIRDEGNDGALEGSAPVEGGDSSKMEDGEGRRAVHSAPRESWGMPPSYA
ncbi:hypothetical protein HDV00_008912 [Rhizophlyctis rosea]|nr:hypothetical protein HDV00_008912 [Rhizophlyctis rosea]